MQKVVCLVSKVNKDEKTKGVGYLIDNNLLFPAISYKGNPYIRIFENITDYCKPVYNAENEYKGYITLSYTNINVYNEEKKQFDTLDYVETTYYVWFKYID